MYAQKMATAIKVHGRSLRESNENVYLPFGSDYSIFFKNLNTVRASIKVEIDGINVTQGVSLVIEPNDSFELERFIKNGNLVSGNRFKFIEKTAAVAAHRGDRVDDGIVRISYQFEKQQHIYVNTGQHNGLNYPTGARGFSGNSITTGTAASIALGSITAASSEAALYNLSCSSAGITAPGAVSDQQFTTVSRFMLEHEKHVIILRLVGEHDGKQVTKPTTTRTTTTCETCGHKTRSATAKFCATCGAALTLIG